MRTAVAIAVSSTLAVISLSGCGASNSTRGSSANNCLIPLAAALRSHHLGDQLLGVRLVSPQVAMRLHLVKYPGREDICLVGFRLRGSAQVHSSMVVYSYDQNSAKVIGVRVMQRHAFRLNHLF